MKVEIPLRLKSIPNLREHWAVRANRAREHRQIGRYYASKLIQAINNFGGANIIEIRLTRYGPRGLDDDNLAAAFKNVRDGIADAIGMDDGSECLRWLYFQENRKAYGIGIEIKSL